jgi:hypothetical protein
VSPATRHPADNILAGDAVLFLLACMLAYASLRSRSRTRQRALERLADVCFLSLSPS